MLMLSVCDIETVCAFPVKWKYVNVLFTACFTAHKRPTYVLMQLKATCRETAMEEANIGSNSTEEKRKYRTKEMLRSDS